MDTNLALAFFVRRRGLKVALLTANQEKETSREDE